MDCVFICKKCGNIEEIDWSKGTENLMCTKCNNPMNWTNAFPNQAVIDFEPTVSSLFELSKKKDKENLDNQYKLIKQDIGNINKTQVDKYINRCEKIIEKYADNDDTLWLKIDDELENELNKTMNENQSKIIMVATRICNQNPFRKAYIIMVASLIEQFFNDYFTELINTKLSSYGSKAFLNKYETAGIQSVIDITEAFLEESLKVKMDKYSKGFFDRWASLRSLRNSIIHSNNRYITKIRVSNVSKIVDESYTVFKYLKSDLYQL